MAPLVPDLLSNELNILSGLLVGLAFGYVLEQAGFSSARRLAGLFYGYDFTVLRVFFTAAITALVGTQLLGYAGLLDLDFVWVNPTFLWPAIVGGIIMGLGFVVGGYCPGTSVCAAATGKKDGAVFVFGGLLGVLAYAEAYPAVVAFVNGSALGPVKVYDSIGISRATFELVLIVAAVGAFAAAGWVERRVNTEAPVRSFPRRWHRLAAAGALGVAVLLYVLPDRKTALLHQVARADYRQAHPVPLMTTDELAFRLLDQDPRLLVIDVRTEEAYKALALPSSVNVPIEGLFAKEWRPIVGRRRLTRVFVDDDGTRAIEAALLAERLGYDNVRALQGGMAALEREILNDQPSGVEPRTPAEQDQRRFRSQARVELARMVEEGRQRTAPAKKSLSKIKGGC